MIRRPGLHILPKDSQLVHMLLTSHTLRWLDCRSGLQDSSVGIRVRVSVEGKLNDQMTCIVIKGPMIVVARDLLNTGVYGTLIPLHRYSLLVPLDCCISCIKAVE
jgi:hypothetical protein